MAGKYFRYSKWMKLPALQFGFWSIKEHLIKKVLAWQASHPEAAYQLWRKRSRFPNNPDPSTAYPQRSSHLPAPFASFIIVVDRENQQRPLDATLKSIMDQGLQNWETLVFVGDWIVDAGSVSSRCSDSRVRSCFLSANEEDDRFARAIAMAKGQFICWLEVGGALVPQALEEAAAVSFKSPESSILYYDTDSFSPDGSRFVAPFFKPGFSPELLLSVNYLRGAFFKREFLSQDIVAPGDPPLSEWDLALRCAERLVSTAHLPKVLYHHPSAVVKSADETRQEAQTALMHHLERKGLSHPHVSFSASGHPKLQWEIKQHEVSIIIPTKDNLFYLRQCIEAIRSLEYSYAYEIILVDTGSQDPEVDAYYQTLKTASDLKLYFDHAPFNYNRINNLGASYASGDLLLFLNNDIGGQAPGWLDELVRWMEYPGVGVVGAKLLYPDRTIQHAGIILGMEGHCSHVFGGAREDADNPFGSIDWYRNYLAVTGACLMTSRSVFDQIGGFDENYRLVFSDVEYCLRAVQHGYRVMYTPFCELIHYEGKSRGRSIPQEDIQRGYEHFITQVRSGDPYYHPALSYSGKRPVFGWPFETPREERLEKIYRFSKIKTS